MHALRRHSDDGVLGRAGTVAALRTCGTADPAAFVAQCERATDCARADGDARSALTRDGVHEVLVAWLCAQRLNADVQVACCRLLRALGPEPYGAHSPGRLRAAEVGAVQAVVAGMRAHAESGSVQRAGCAALWWLCRTPSVAATTAAADALDAVVCAMRVHATHARVNEAGCGALRNMAMVPRNAALAPAAGALDVVVSALRVHRADARVQEQASGALVNLAAESRAAELAVEAGALEALLAALAAHVDEPGVCLPASIALYNLIWKWPAAQRRARGAGAPSVLRELLARAPRRLAEADAAVLRDAAQRVLTKVEHAAEPASPLHAQPHAPLRERAGPLNRGL